MRTLQPSVSRGATSRRRRRVVGLLCTVLAGATLVLAPTEPAHAADLTAFDPGNLITDENFFHADSMNVSQIQAFLSAQGASCRVATDGSVCLKDYVQDTPTRDADTRCTSTYAGRAGQSAAQIIAGVAQACGINPRVLLVMLQKEQGLITASTTSATKYRSAMGYGCPDTAACDSAYYGFFNQVYKAAWQFKSYALTPKSWQHRAGIVNNVRFHPNVACGTSPVLIKNQATAGLYNYTPYQPNSAALAAGYGTGDSCSSYGNRNFWNYYTDWFGDPKGVPPIGSLDSRTATNTSIALSGWALDPDTNSSIDIHVYVDGVGTAFRADASRSDVAAAFGRGDKHGFAVTIPASPGPHSICTFAIGSDGGSNTLLDCSSIVVPDSAPVGTVDSTTTTPSSVTISGWTFDPDTQESNDVHIYIDGVGVAIKSDLSRPDIAAVFGRGDRHGFSYTAPMRPGHHEMCVYAINTVAGANTMLQCRSFAVDTTTAGPIGVVDSIAPSATGVTVSGWTIDPDTTDPTEVHIYVDGVGTSVLANQSRPDVDAVYRRGPLHGFGHSIPLAAGAHSICVYAINTGAGPHTLLTCRSFTVSNAAPIGVVDSVVPGPGTVTIAGWTLDPDTRDPIASHVYIDGVGVEVIADISRPDIAAVFGRGDRHGFSYVASLTPGVHAMCVHGINATPGGANTLLRCSSFTVL